MANFGLTLNGFVAKRLSDIKLELENDLRDRFGDINVDAESVFGQLIGVKSKALADVWEQAENIYNAMYPSTADGVSLDQSSSLVGVDRLTATASTVIIQMLGTNSTVVPINTEVSQSTSSIVFITDEAKTISSLAMHKTKVEVTTVVDSFAYTVTINGGPAGYLSSSSATADEIAQGLTDQINVLPQFNTLMLAEHTSGDDFFIVTTIDRTVDNTFSLVANTNLTRLEIHSPISVTAVNSGPSPVPQQTIDTIDTPVAGLTSIQNIDDGITGKDIESDSDYRLRRKISLDVISAAVIGAIQSRLVQDLPEVNNAFVFENRDDIWDGNGINITTYDADFVSSNLISFSVDGQSITPVVFTIDHSTTMGVLQVSVQALSTVLTAEIVDISGANRILKVVSAIKNGTLFRTDQAISVVTSGISQAIATIITSNDGKAPHGIEAVVSALDTTVINKKIADKVYELKSGGIQTSGTKEMDVIDSNGDIQKIKFSHSITKYVHVQLDYDTSNSDSQFPLDGDEIIEQAILDLGTKLSFGKDLLIQQFENTGYAAGGVTNVVIRLAVTDTDPGSPSFGTSNITINTSELPNFDISRIDINDITP